MAASTHFLSLAPQTLSLHHTNSSAAASVPSLFTPSSFKSLPKLALAFSPSTRSHTTSKFVRFVALSSDLDEDGAPSFNAPEPEYSDDVKLFVGNLPFTVDSAALAQLLEKAGDVEQVEVIYDKATGRSRGFGFVVMSTAKDAQNAVKLFNGYELGGRPLRVNSGPAPPKRDMSSFRGERDNSSFRGGPGQGGSRGQSSFGSSNRVYVGNLSWNVDNNELAELFGNHGNVKEARVVYDRESGRSRGFGFVTYSSSEEVNAAIDRLDGSDLDGRPLKVSPAEERSR